MNVTSPQNTLLSIENLTVGYGERIIQQDINFTVKKGSIFALMGGSGCGKSTLLKSMIGLLPPKNGDFLVKSENYWKANKNHRVEIARNFGVLFQSAALWSSMTVGENIALPLQLFTNLSASMIQRLVEMKLGLVGMSHAINLYPSELSGGMKKRCGLARALALDPEILFFDEPSAGLDPITSKRLDDLILNLRDGLGTTIIIVSHELPSLFTIADDGIFLDAETKRPIAHGSPRALRDNPPCALVNDFMHRQTVQNPK
ncbi:ATPase subunit MlaF of the ABC-type intermembrane phospholipid transporter Mla (MlaF) (PDB:6IC4) [Commensalibacter communis]|uniref:ABC transporter ATP-binding protein n=1 Tax=Commensalibacter communis TaxID=2972786 RepID=UPI0022FF9D26|nr:ATP-binding cassette domain-containing protein [Commensalibacter communis]CAI3947379.1 ATPase subunit MlaF of the ABC-type intermembrane phospholipid transporter Mla (MlaF) (PDB:6IC4) [Commensalibacter communis]